MLLQATVKKGDARHSASWVLTKIMVAIYWGNKPNKWKKKSKRIKISDCISCWDQLRIDLGWLSQTVPTVKETATTWIEHIFKSRELWVPPAPLSLQRPNTADQASSISSTEPPSVQLPTLASSNPCLLQPFQDQLHTQHVKRQTAEQAEHLLPGVEGKGYLYLRLFSEKLCFMTSKTCFWKLKTLVGSPKVYQTLE